MNDMWNNWQVILFMVVFFKFSNVKYLIVSSKCVSLSLKIGTLWASSLFFISLKPKKKKTNSVQSLKWFEILHASTIQSSENHPNVHP